MINFVRSRQLYYGKGNVSVVANAKNVAYELFSKKGLCRVHTFAMPHVSVGEKSVAQT